MPSYTHYRQAHTGAAAKALGVWHLVGLVLASLMALVAVVNARRNGTNYYEAEIYGMTPRTHLIAALVSACFAGAFAAAPRWHLPTIALLAVFTLLAILYGTSFLRGFSEQD